MDSGKPGPKKRVYERLTVSLAQGQRASLGRLAQKYDQSLAQIIRHALLRLIKEERVKSGRAERYKSPLHGE